MAGGDKSKKSNKNPKKGHGRDDAKPKRVPQQETSPPDPTSGYYPPDPQSYYSSNTGGPSNVALPPPNQLASGGASLPFGYTSLSSRPGFAVPNSQSQTQSGGDYDMAQFAVTDAHLNQSILRRDSGMSTQAQTGSPKHSRNPSRELDPVTNAEMGPPVREPPIQGSLDRIDYMNSKGNPFWTHVNAGNRGPASYGGQANDSVDQAPQTAGFVHGSSVGGNNPSIYQPNTGLNDYSMPSDYQPHLYYSHMEGKDDYGEDDQGEEYPPEQTQQSSSSKGKEKSKDKKKHRGK